MRLFGANLGAYRGLIQGHSRVLGCYCRVICRCPLTYNVFQFGFVFPFPFDLDFFFQRILRSILKENTQMPHVYALFALMFAPKWRFIRG